MTTANIPPSHLSGFGNISPNRYDYIDKQSIILFIEWVKDKTYPYPYIAMNQKVQNPGLCELT